MNNAAKEFLLIVSCIIIPALTFLFMVDLSAFSSIKNIPLVFAGHELFVGAFAVATLFAAYLVTVAKTNFYIRFAAIPFWLVFTILMFITVDNFLGKPYPIIPPQATVLSYRMYLDENRDKQIEAWMYLKEDKVSRLYKFPYTRSMEQALEQAKKEGSTGKQVEVELEGDRQDKDGNLVKPDWAQMLKYDIRHSGLPTKPGESAPAPRVPQAQPEAPMPNDGNIMITLPDGSQIEIPVGQDFSVTGSGEILLQQPTLAPNSTAVKPSHSR